MIGESKQDSHQNPYAPSGVRHTNDESNNELIRTPRLRQLIRWPLIVGIPILLAGVNGIRAFLMTPTGGDFFGFALIANIVIGCLVGGCIGAAISAAFWALTRHSSHH